MAIHVRNLSQFRTLTRILRRQRIRSAIASFVFIIASLFILSQLTIFILSEQPSAFEAYIPGDNSSQGQEQAAGSSSSAASAHAVPQVNIIPAIESTISADISMTDIEFVSPEPIEAVSEGIDLGVDIGLGSLGDGLGAYGAGEGANGLGSAEGGNSTLEGTLYDLKQLRGGGDSEFAEMSGNTGVVNLLSDFYMRGWNRARLLKYKQAPTKLYTSNFYLPNCKDEEAPYAYQVSDSMKGSRWVALYRGQIRAPKSGRFRFLGIGDSILAIRFNRRNVLQCGFHSLTAQQKWNTHRQEIYDRGEDTICYKETDYWNTLFAWNNIHYHIPRPEDLVATMEKDCVFPIIKQEKTIVKTPIYETGPLDPGAQRKFLRYEERESIRNVTVGSYTKLAKHVHPIMDSLYCLHFDLVNSNYLTGGFEAGEEFKVQANQWYDFELMLSEIGGGNFGCCVLIEDLSDPTDAKDANGQRIYPLFRTSFNEPDPKKFYETIHFPIKEEEKTYPPYDRDSIMVWQARHPQKS